MRCQHRIEELVRLFGVAVGEQFHRALEVGKEHRDLLPLAFQGTAGRENFLREIGWGVGERRLRGAPRGAVPARAWQRHRSRPDSTHIVATAVRRGVRPSGCQRVVVELN